MKKCLICLLLLPLALTGCSGKGLVRETSAEIIESTTLSLLPTEPYRVPTPTPVPVLKEDLSNKRRSLLTGMFIDKEAAMRRPFAVVINNMRKAIPQSGISQADIIYEVLAEGDITRLVAIFQDFDSEKIGPVRSTRDYFVDFALDHDALFVHHGGSDNGYIAVKTLPVDNFDGMSLEGVTFWRDKARVNQPGMYEHSSYTDTARLFAAAEKRGSRTTVKDDAKSMFSFYADSMSPAASNPSTKITVPFSPNYTSVFEYDAISKLYFKYQGSEKHIDAENNEQLAVANVIVQFADMRVVDDVGRRAVSLISSGTGYIFTNGQYAPITWKKTSHTAPTEWFDEWGDKLRLNMGKTWICVYRGDIKIE